MTEGYPGQPAETDPLVGADQPEAADPRVRAAVRRLDELGDTPPAGHVEVFEAVHRSLQESLAEAAHDQRPSDPDAGR